jgi:hypothetical protein
VIENYKNVQKFLGYLNLNLGNKNDIVQVQITIAMKLDFHFFLYKADLTCDVY